MHARLKWKSRADPQRIASGELHDSRRVAPQQHDSRLRLGHVSRANPVHSVSNNYEPQL
jgi:hypothetical protein